MAACRARIKKRKMNKVWRKGLHSVSAPAEREHFCFLLLGGCRASVSGWCLEYEPAVVLGLRGIEPLGIDMSCESMATEANIINVSALPDIDSGLYSHTRGH